MRRTRLLLEQSQYEELEAMADQTGRSISQPVRDMVSDTLGRRPRRRTRLLDLAGMVKGGPADLGEKHDRYLYGARKKGL